MCHPARVGNGKFSLRMPISLREQNPSAEKRQLRSESTEMARRYSEEMSRLATTFDWAATADLQLLRGAVRIGGTGTLCAVGSGGSLTGAHALAQLHQRCAGRLATVATPLEVVDDSFRANPATWLLSAGGSNVDIMAAARALILREPRQLSVLCGRESSPLAELCRRHPFVDILLYPSPVGRDGFLATNSLFGFTTLLTRAYATEYGADAEWQEAVDCVTPLLRQPSAAVDAWEAATLPLWSRSTILALHGTHTRIGAVDLESKFTEAALGHVKVADYRNFAHGRHHWLAKRGEESVILAFTTKTDRPLAESTLSVIPDDVPKVRIHLEGGPCASGLASLLAAFRITEWAGRRVGIDPGRPGVPQFGRKLFHQPFPRHRRVPRRLRLTGREVAAIRRKIGVDPKMLDDGDLRRWRGALATFLDRMYAADFAGVVLDYDGTLVDTRNRLMPATASMAASLVRLLKAGVRVAIATGRGKSVRQDLRFCLPQELWSLVSVGYYNGAEIASLTDDGAPDNSPRVCGTLQPIADALRRREELTTCVHQTDRPHQITLQLKWPVPDNRVWYLVREVIASASTRDVDVTRSGHSIDILPKGVSKVNVVRRLRQTVGGTQILVVGDQGRWPGNDYDLLREEYSLGVDEVSTDPHTCWNVGQPGQRGPSVTLNYLSRT